MKFTLVMAAIPVAAGYAPLSHGEDDVATVEVLKKAYETHLKSVESGRMVFAMHFDQLEAGQSEDIKGEIEWADSYYYFEGEITQIYPGFGLGEKRVQSLRTLVLDGTMLSWRHETVPMEKIHVAYVPESEMGRMGWDAISPDPLVYLASLEAHSFSFTRGWFDYPMSPIVTDSVMGPISRDVNVEGATVTVKSVYQNDWDQELTFNMDQGGLFHAVKTNRYLGDRTKLEDTTWEWVQNDEGVWYPKSCHLVCTHGVLSEEYAKYECHISSLEPLKVRRYTRLRSQTELGEIPDGADYTFMRDDGLRRTIVIGSEDADPVSESALRELSRSLSESGFGKSK